MCRVVCSGYAVLTVGVLCCALALVAPYWLYYTEDALTGVDKFFGVNSQLLSEGLSGEVNRENKVKWLWDDDFQWEKKKPDWTKACQGLFAAGLLLLIVAWSISTFHVCCCRCCKESYSVTSALGSLTLSGVVLIAASLTVYGVFAAKSYGDGGRQAGFGEGNTYFYWAFFVGITGAALCLSTAILFFCDGCRTRSHSGYHMTRVV